jgi:hypothetical protein
MCWRAGTEQRRPEREKIASMYTSRRMFMVGGGLALVPASEPCSAQLPLAPPRGLVWAPSWAQSTSSSTHAGKRSNLAELSGG